MLILASSFNFEGSHLPVLGNDDLPYPISIKTNFRRINDRYTKNTKMPIGYEVRGQLDFLDVIRQREIIINSDNYLIVNTIGKFLGIVPTPRANNHPPIQMPVTLENYNDAVSSLRQDFSDLKECLDRTLMLNSFTECINNLRLFIRDHANDNEFISILISTNDRRIEYLPFEETTFIRELVGSRPFGIQFTPGRYL